MKDNHSPSHPILKSRWLLTTIPAVAVFFLVGYILGLLSAFPSSSSSSSSPPTPINPQTPISTSTLQKLAESTVTRNSVDTEPPPSLLPPPPLPPPPPHDLYRFRTQCSYPIPHSEVRQTILAYIYSNTSPYTDFPSDETASHLLPVWNKLRGWGSRNRVFADLITSVRPLTIIELGTFLGASALHMASIARNLSLPTTILCLDDFRGWPAFRSKFPRDLLRPRHGDSLLLHQFMLGVVAADETDRIIPMPFSTGSSLAALCEWGVYGDLIEVDAGHVFHSAWSDINMAYALLRPGGVLFGHDYFTAADDRGVRRAVNLFAKLNGVKVRANGEHWFFSPKPQS